LVERIIKKTTASSWNCFDPLRSVACIDAAWQAEKEKRIACTGVKEKSERALLIVQNGTKKRRVQVTKKVGLHL
jgi:hypothetical protein